MPSLTACRSRGCHCQRHTRTCRGRSCYRRYRARITVRRWGILLAVANVAAGALIHDEESGLVYSRARDLQPTLGRWMQRDPIGDPGTGEWASERDLTSNALKATKKKLAQMFGPRPSVSTPLLRYADGMNLYLDEFDNPVDRLDPSGATPPPLPPATPYAEWVLKCQDECEKYYYGQEQPLLDCMNNCRDQIWPTGPGAPSWPWYKCFANWVFHKFF